MSVIFNVPAAVFSTVRYFKKFAVRWVNPCVYHTRLLPVARCAGSQTSLTMIVGHKYCTFLDPCEIWIDHLFYQQQFQYWAPIQKPDHRSVRTTQVFFATWCSRSSESTSPAHVACLAHGWYNRWRLLLIKRIRATSSSPSLGVRQTSNLTLKQKAHFKPWVFFSRIKA